MGTDTKSVLPGSIEPSHKGMDTDAKSALPASVEAGHKAVEVSAAINMDSQLQEEISELSALHNNGYLELGKLPDWEVFDLVEIYYAKYYKEILELLEGARPRWFEDVKEGGCRPGHVIAKEFSKKHYESKGIWISAVHPSVSADDPYPTTGPRFYVSVMPALMWRGSAPSPPKAAAHLLWPDDADRERPYITEVGWVMTPPGSDAQAMHVDIKSDYSGDEIPDPREDSRGRFHHFIWKIDRTANCTTGIVPGTFQNGDIQDWMFKSIRKVSSPAVVIDSEVCHCGSATGPDGWTSSCTVQLCSSTGWKPLQSRASKELLDYTVPIDSKFAGPFLALPVDEEDVAKHLRYGGRLEWVVGSLVDVKVKDNWFPATIGQRNLDNSYHVHRNGDPVRLTEQVLLTNIRERRWDLGSELEYKCSGEWYQVKVVKVNDDWSYKVQWDDEESCYDLAYHNELRSYVKMPSKKRARTESSADALDDSKSPGKRLKEDSSLLPEATPTDRAETESVADVLNDSKFPGEHAKEEPTPTAMLEKPPGDWVMRGVQASEVSLLPVSAPIVMAA